MKILGIIPSRYASTRLPGKPLIYLGGKTMIQRVYEQATKSVLLHDVVVATDDDRIFQEVNRFGGKALMTKTSHSNGTERCAEVVDHFPDCDYVINIQGDEPFVHPEQIDEVALLLDGGVKLATLVKKIDEPSALEEPSQVKAVFNKEKEAVYFSRNPIPYLRNYPRSEWLDHHTFYKHIGIYGYRRDVLLRITKLPPGVLEMAESLEQLRWIENGLKIKIGITELESTMIDTPADVAKAVKEYDL